jgi:hypothetical protein
MPRGRRRVSPEGWPGRARLSPASAGLHGGERLCVDKAIAVAEAQKFEEVLPTLQARGAEPGEVLVANVRVPFTPRWRAPVSSTVIQAAD